MNTKLAIAVAATALLLLLVLVTVHRSHHTETAGPAHQQTSTSHPATTPASANGETLLPFTPGQISQATQLATRFAATYASHRYDETPSAYLARLTSMMSPQLRPGIERAATDPVTLTQRRRLEQITTAEARPDVIRALGPTSITFLITVTEHVATAHANRTDTSHYALTLAIGQADDGSGGWQVYAIELASTGNTGQLTATPDPAS